MSIEKGQRAEIFARRYLEKQGLSFYESNYHCRRGEIDLIMRDGLDLVFVEVRYRSSQLYGGALESITSAKKNKIIAAAEHYLLCNESLTFKGCRFDIISLTGTPPEYLVDWRKGAFFND